MEKPKYFAVRILLEYYNYYCVDEVMKILVNRGDGSRSDIGDGKKKK